ncbi:MAG: DUF2442 domain-containing protein [Oscillospiraceae bacterium]|nr:DUF2442 domain-containing protein [Oscillospiraceae bacterium]
MFHKVASVEQWDGCSLNVLFLDETRKEYDIRCLFDRYPMFRQLAEDEALFRQVKVDQGGYGVSWNDELDLSCDELYDHGRRMDSRTPKYESAFVFERI